MQACLNCDSVIELVFESASLGELTQLSKSLHWVSQTGLTVI